MRVGIAYRTGAAIIRGYAQQLEYPVSGSKKRFSLGLDRSTCDCNVALDYLGQPSDKTSLIMGRALRKTAELIRCPLLAGLTHQPSDDRRAYRSFNSSESSRVLPSFLVAYACEDFLAAADTNSLNQAPISSRVCRNSSGCSVLDAAAGSMKLW